MSGDGHEVRTSHKQSSLVQLVEPQPIRFDDLHVDKIPLDPARRFMEEHHYSGGLGNAAMTWGVYQNATGKLIGVIAFQTPISENTRDLIFGDHVCGCQLVDPKACNRDDCAVRGDHHHVGEHVTELHRLAVVPEAPKNLGSWSISKALTRLKDYKPKYWAVISMADSTEGHDGTQYQGANADYYGTTEEKIAYIDQQGRLRTRRQCGDNITLAEAKERGWTVSKREVKHRYVFWLPYRSRYSQDGLRELAEIGIQPYPGGEADE